MINIGDTVSFLIFPIIHTGVVQKIEITEKETKYFFLNGLESDNVFLSKKEAIESARKFTVTECEKEIKRAREKMEERLKSLDEIKF